MRQPLFIVAALLAAACGQATTGGEAEDPAPRDEAEPEPPRPDPNPPPPDPDRASPPHAWPSDTPPRDACAADADCTVVVTAPGPDPCCDFTATASPLSRRYLEFVAAFRARECASVRCPPLSLPGARLAECGYEGRCRDGRCTNACGP